MSTTYKVLIGGEWLSARQQETLPVVSPSDGSTFAEIARGTVEDIDHAVEAARRAVDGAWGNLTALERGRLLLRLSERVLANRDVLARLEASDTGKTHTQASNDILACARYLEFYGAAADKVHGEVLPYLNGYSVSVLKEPHGVTGHILPWNYPAQMFGRSLAPALAMGNAVVVKPAEEACLSILEIARLAEEVGFPPGAINVVTGLGHEVGAALSEHPGVAFLSFTGSPEVGALVQQAASRHHAGCVLELGGKSPQLIFADADLDKAADKVIGAIVQNAGQTCSAGSRVLIQQTILDDFLLRLKERFASISVGSSDMDLHCGPLISRKQRDRVEQFIEQAKSDGLRLVAEGQLAADLPDEGFYIRPALFGPIPRDHLLAREEVFGPVLVALAFEDEEDAIALANDTDYGLVAGVWTSDGGRQMRVSKRLHCGQVFINDYGAGGGVELPFGGVKKSGHGREKGLAALEEFCVTKTVVLNHG